MTTRTIYPRETIHSCVYFFHQIANAADTYDMPVDDSINNLRLNKSNLLDPYEYLPTQSTEKWDITIRSMEDICNWLQRQVSVDEYQSRNSFIGHFNYQTNQRREAHKYGNDLIVGLTVIELARVLEKIRGNSENPILTQDTEYITTISMAVILSRLACIPKPSGSVTQIWEITNGKVIHKMLINNAHIISDVHDYWSPNLETEDDKKRDRVGIFVEAVLRPFLPDQRWDNTSLTRTALEASRTLNARVNDLTPQPHGLSNNQSPHSISPHLAHQRGNQDNDHGAGSVGLVRTPRHIGTPKTHPYTQRSRPSPLRNSVVPDNQSDEPTPSSSANALSTASNAYLHRQ
ncbi:hypothetical protein TREMEDRAFT_59687 [Tremella mesenterica DSM 1558]|uniref:uncharacterized protein n=1 Tax=Tremella mesenterica (strain ATCC 24925 / CBS 8224 / DSM 1558 / NBRC 9311 / NRRL Y-6157 / RJB 2259-6 / UBC 559-6) TaxID=578456 RepID=UPI0003F49198|nr:uncharacterized protein TREMEDRAFT_59687 [Tremella mesenterica DSM 1558]EIW73513.1 hypothetical protein TREMEDRAFT_59687 [Tremella mesenterica DSM 1558]